MRRARPTGHRLAAVQKNRPARIALWLLGPLFLAAVLVPLLASDRRWCSSIDGQTLYPWFRALWNPEQPVDFAFNMALVGLGPWAAAGGRGQRAAGAAGPSTVRRMVGPATRAPGRRPCTPAVPGARARRFSLSPAPAAENRY